MTATGGHARIRTAQLIALTALALALGGVTTASASTTGIHILHCSALSVTGPSVGQPTRISNIQALGTTCAKADALVRRAYYVADIADAAPDESGNLARDIAGTKYSCLGGLRGNYDSSIAWNCAVPSGDPGISWTATVNATTTTTTTTHTTTYLPAKDCPGGQPIVTGTCAPMKCPANDYAYSGGCLAYPSMKSLERTFSTAIQSALNKGQYEYSDGLVRGSHVDGNAICQWTGNQSGVTGANCWATVSEPGGDVYQIGATFTFHGPAGFAWPKSVSIRRAG